MSGTENTRMALEKPKLEKCMVSESLLILIWPMEWTHYKNMHGPSPPGIHNTASVMLKHFVFIPSLLRLGWSCDLLWPMEYTISDYGWFRCGTLGLHTPCLLPWNPAIDIWISPSYPAGGWPEMKWPTDIIFEGPAPNKPVGDNTCQLRPEEMPT